jgi:formate dehydrogenase major subunit
MGLSRRDFLKLSGGTAIAGAIGAGLSPKEVSAKEQILRIKGARETTTICPY